MSATDELRRLLDERGVEWEPSVFDPQHETFYSTENGVGFIVTEFPEIGRVSLACDMRITPEQAVEATLGRGKCHNAETREGYFACSGCGFTFSSWGGFGCDCGDDPDFRYCPECGREVER